MSGAGIRRLVLLAVLIVALSGLAALAVPDHDPPVAVVGHAGVTVPPPSTTIPVPTTATAPPTTAKPAADVATRSTTVVRSGSGGVNVTNSGSAVASTGGNTVIGPPDASVTKGPASAVGTSEVRITPP